MTLTTPADVPTDHPSPSPALYPFRSRFLRTSRATVHYVDEGAGRPLLLCHGNPTWSFLFRHLIAELRSEFRCIAIDLPGFGLSERPPGFGYTALEHAGVVEEVVDHLALEDVVVMGHDWGGPIGTEVAVRRPDRVGGLVLGNTWFWPSGPRARMFSRVMSSRPLQHAILHRNLFVERILPAAVNRTLTPEEMEHYRAVQPTPEARAGIAVFPRELRTAEPMLRRLASAVPERLGDKPLLVTYPMRDVAFPAAASIPRMRAAFPDHVVVELPRAKHFFLEDESPAVAAAVRRRFA